MIRAILVAGFTGLVATVAFAADPAARRPAPAAPEPSAACKETEKTAIPNDAFGFSSGADVTDLGGKALSLELGANLKGGGFKPGNFAQYTAKSQFQTSFVPCWDFDPYVLGTTSTGSTEFVPGRVAFNTIGVGLENKYKLLGRSTHGVGLTVDHDFNVQGFSQSDTTLAIPLNWRGQQYNNSFRVFVDKDFLDGKIVTGVNLSWDMIWTSRPSILNPGVTGDFARASNLTASAVVAYQFRDGFFLGAEARYVRTYAGVAFNKFSGDGVYVGPNFYFQLAKNISLNGAYAVEVSGNSRAIAPATTTLLQRSSDLNLFTLNQHIAKLKLGVSF